MLLSPRKNGRTSLFKEVRVFKEFNLGLWKFPAKRGPWWVARLKVPFFQRKTKGGGKTQGRGKHTIKPLPKNGFWDPLPMTLRLLKAVNSEDRGLKVRFSLADDSI